MKQKLNKKNFYELIKGASIFTTGGGCPVDFQNDNVDSLPNNSFIEIWDIEEFNTNDFLITALELGPSSAPVLDKKNILSKMISLLEKVSNTNIAGFYGGELGQENVLIESSVYTSKPIADFDIGGGRAVPCVDLTTPNALDMSFSIAPLVLCTDMGEIVYLEGCSSENRIEDVLRKISELSKDKIIFILGGLIKVQDIIETKVINNSLSKALKTSKFKTIKEIKDYLNPKFELSGKVISSQKISKSGFNASKSLFETTDGQLFNIIIQNELLFILDKNNNPVYSVPDRILIIKKDGLIGCSSRDFVKGEPVELLVVEAENAWKTEKGLKLFGKDRFKDLLK